MRDCAGLEDASDETSESESAGPGDGGSAAGAGAGASAMGVDGLSIGRDDSGCLFDCVRSEGGMVPALCLKEPAGLTDDEVGMVWVRFTAAVLKLVPGPALGVFGTLQSFLVVGASFRMDNDEGALAWAGSPGPEVVLPIAIADSEPGTGDGAAELLTAAVAFRIWACI